MKTSRVKRIYTVVVACGRVGDRPIDYRKTPNLLCDCHYPCWVPGFTLTCIANTSAMDSSLREFYAKMLNILYAVMTYF